VDALERVRASFARQRFMELLGARLIHLAPGEADIELARDERLANQHGYLHAGAVASVLDSACGYAALTLMDADAAVVTVEFKISLLAPATGESLLARGRVDRAGRTLTFCTGEAVAGDTRVATFSATMMAVRGRAGLVD
jgi:uncharacterized protein (TIGR00369 family)